MPARVALAALVLVLLVLTPSSAAAVLTRDQVINRGDNACYRERTGTGAAWRRHKPYRPFSAYHDNVAAMLRDIRQVHIRANRRLSRLLRRAEGDGKVHLRLYVRGRKKLVRYMRRMIRAAELGDEPTYRSRLYTHNRRAARNKRHARRYGFEVCGR